VISVARRAFLNGSIGLALAVCAAPASSQTKTETTAPSVVLVRAARLLDARTGHYIDSAAILIEGER
jgi:hypothetical protein